MKFYMFRTDPLPIIMSYAMVYVIRGMQFHPDPAAARKMSTNLYDIYHC
jgi:uncharacterized protein YjeT (DUF2065 family)